MNDFFQMNRERKSRSIFWKIRNPQGATGVPKKIVKKNFKFSVKFSENIPCKNSNFAGSAQLLVSFTAGAKSKSRCDRDSIDFMIIWKLKILNGLHSVSYFRISRHCLQLLVHCASNKICEARVKSVSSIIISPPSIDLHPIKVLPLLGHMKTFICSNVPLNIFDHRRHRCPPLRITSSIDSRVWKLNLLIDYLLYQNEPSSGLVTYRHVRFSISTNFIATIRGLIRSVDPPFHYCCSSSVSVSSKMNKAADEKFTKFIHAVKDRSDPKWWSKTENGGAFVHSRQGSWFPWRIFIHSAKRPVENKRQYFSKSRNIPELL